MLVVLTDSRRDLRSQIVRRDYPYSIDRYIRNELEKYSKKRERMLQKGVLV
jgi:hypothetical protein